MRITLPEFSLVLLIGPSGAGKSTFAREHFLPTEIISSDQCRGMVTDDENSLDASDDAFELLRFILAKRLKRKRLTVIDATNVQRESRKPLLDLAREYHAMTMAILLDIPEKVCHERNALRPDRNFGPHVVRNHTQQMRRSLKGLKREGVRLIHRFRSVEDLEQVEFVRQPLWTDRRDLTGPFDIIGDLHGCYHELSLLLERLGYQRGEWKEESGSTVGAPTHNLTYSHPQGRTAVFLGDLVDRGPRNLDTLFLVRNMVQSGSALCVPGNHDMKFLKALRGRNVQVRHGLEKTLAELEELPDEIRPEITSAAIEFLDSLISHFELDMGRLVVAHAGMTETMQGRASRSVRDFALFGETTGETDEFGLPVRYNWAAEYRGKSMVVYGHTPIPNPEWFNNTVNIDTGCVFGGRLTALQYPEKTFVSVEAAEVYSDPIRPIFPKSGIGDTGEPSDTSGPDSSLNHHSQQQEHDTLLDIEDVFGKRQITTELMGRVTVRAENSSAALEVMSRFAVDPRWLIYLPPTMSPVETSTEGDYLERPEEAFAYYRREGVERVICEEKHMGSRAVVVMGRDVESANQRFGLSGTEQGVIYTRTGRRFFNDRDLERQLLQHVSQQLTRQNFWETFETDWFCIDCELMPWSAKAQELLRAQDAAVGTAAKVGTRRASEILAVGQERGLDLGDIQSRWNRKEKDIDQYVEAYRQYCWPVERFEDFRLAPFHILATEGGIHTDKDHEWHMSNIGHFFGGELPLYPTRHITIDLARQEDIDRGIAWWEDLTGAGGEGMVVKPMNFIATGRKGLAQPAVKVRGREYLRIIYGPEYTAPENLPRLRSRSLGSKRSLALREFSLGIESLRRFVSHAPLRHVHEAVFGVLALESVPVDPRL